MQQYEDGIGTSYAYNAANEITQDGTLTYTFDAGGNELTNSGGLSYTYNARNQTTNVSSTQPPNSLGMTYTGPDQNERLTAGVHSYTYSLTGMYSDTASSGFQSSVNMPASTLGAKPAASIESPVQATLSHNQPGTVSTSLASPAGGYYFTRDPGGTLISETTPSGKYYYSFSAVELPVGPNPGALSVAATSDSSGAVADSYINCPTGNNISQTGTAPNSWHTQSSYYDSSTGTQLYFGNGIDDSTIGRWNQTVGATLMFSGSTLQPVPGFTPPLGLYAGPVYHEYVDYNLTGTAVPIDDVPVLVGPTAGVLVNEGTGRVYPYSGLAIGAQSSVSQLIGHGSVNPGLSVGVTAVAPWGGAVSAGFTLGRQGITSYSQFGGTSSGGGLSAQVTLSGGYLGP